MGSLVPQPRRRAAPTRLPTTSVSFLSFQRSEVMPGDLFAGRLPDAVELVDVGERAVERTDAVRLTHDEGMQADRHHARRLGAFAPEHLELVADHALELARR